MDPAGAAPADGDDDDDDDDDAAAVGLASCATTASTTSSSMFPIMSCNSLPYRPSNPARPPALSPIISRSSLMPSVRINFSICSFTARSAVVGSWSPPSTAAACMLLRLSIRWRNCCLILSWDSSSGDCWTCVTWSCRSGISTCSSEYSMCGISGGFELLLPVPDASSSATLAPSAIEGCDRVERVIGHCRFMKAVRRWSSPCSRFVEPICGRARRARRLEIPQRVINGQGREGRVCPGLDETWLLRDGRDV